MTKIRVLLADDHPIVRRGIRSLLQTAPDIEVVAEAKSGQDALNLVEEMSPDVLLLDMEMPGMSGVDVAKHLKSARSAVRVLGAECLRRRPVCAQSAGQWGSRLYHQRKKRLK